MTEVWRRIQRHRTETQARVHAEAERHWHGQERQLAPENLPVEHFLVAIAVARELAAMGVA